MAQRNWLDLLERVEIRSRAEWRRWLEAHHDRDEGIWVVRYKKNSSGPHVSYEDVVEEALCFGWIDSLPRKLDEERSMLLLSPRRAGSGWSKLNKSRVARLIKGRAMTPAGLLKIERAKRDGTWNKLDGSESLEVPADLGRALAKNRKAREAFGRFSESSRRRLIWFVNSAKREETRSKRIAEVVRLAARGLRAGYPEASRQ